MFHVLEFYLFLTELIERYVYTYIMPIAKTNKQVPAFLAYLTLTNLVHPIALPAIPELGGTLRGAAVAITHDAQRITR